MSNQAHNALCAWSLTISNMKLKLEIKGKTYDIELTEFDEKVKIEVNKKEFVFNQKEISKEKRIKVAKSYLPQKRDFKEKEIKSPIAGIISEIFIKENQPVKKNQKLLVLSAMKMENEVVSDFDGKIKEIFVKKNQKVKKDQILLIIR